MRAIVGRCPAAPGIGLKQVMGAWASIAVALSLGCSDKSTRVLQPEPEPESGRIVYGSHYPYHQCQPAWSSRNQIAYRDNGVVYVFPDGNTIIDSSLAGLWVLDMSSKLARRLLPYGNAPSWSPDGSDIAFESGGQVYCIAADGSNLRRLTTSGLHFFPSWHPGGTAIIYDTELGYRPGTYALGEINLSDSTALIMCASSPIIGRMPCWAPGGGKFVALLSGPPGATSSELGSVASLTCAQSRLTWSPDTESSPKYSPDGARIAFTSQSDAVGSRSVWIMGADGTNPHPAMTKQSAWPAWSPDGAQIAYVDARLDYSSSAGVLWSLDLRTGAQVQLTHHWGAAQASP